MPVCPALMAFALVCIAIGGLTALYALGAFLVQLTGADRPLSTPLGTDY